MAAARAPSRKEYRRVRAEAPAEKSATAENEIKVTAKRGQRSYITYAIALLNGEDGKSKHDTIKVSGMGAAIFNVVNIAEIVKRRVKGIHQVTEISSQVVHDSYEPVEKGKENLEVDRKVSTILITLSTKQLDKSNIGYQAPLPEDQVTEQEDRKPGETTRRGRGEGRGRGSGERGSGRGGRGGRGEGRGGRGSGERGSGRGGRGGRGEGRGGRGGSRGGDRDREGGSRGGRGSIGRGGDRGGRGGRGGERGGRGSGGRGGDRRDDRRDDRRRDDRPPARGGRGSGSGRGGERGGRGGERGSGRGGRGRN